MEHYVVPKEYKMTYAGILLASYSLKYPDFNVHVNEYKNMNRITRIFKIAEVQNKCTEPYHYALYTDLKKYFEKIDGR